VADGLFPVQLSFGRGEEDVAAFGGPSF